MTHTTAVVDTIERQLASLMPEQHGFERLDWARKIATSIADDLEVAIDEESEAKSEEKLKDAHDEGFDKGAKAERVIADKEIAAEYEKGYAACEKDTGMTAP